MTKHVISHRQPRRKRGARRPVLRRFGALIVTIAALGAASWLAPALYRPAPAPAPVAVVEIPAPALKRPPPAEAVKVFTFAEAAPAAEPLRPRRARRSGIPLDVIPAQVGEDFEILTAAELDAISQARN